MQTAQKPRCIFYYNQQEETTGSVNFSLLSLMSSFPILFEGSIYQSGEQAFQAEKMKFLTKLVMNNDQQRGELNSIRSKILKTESPHEARYLGSNLPDFARDEINRWYFQEERILKNICHSIVKSHGDIYQSVYKLQKMYLVHGEKQELESMRAWCALNDKAFDEKEMKVGRRKNVLGKMWMDLIQEYYNYLRAEMRY